MNWAEILRQAYLSQDGSRMVASKIVKSRSIKHDKVDATIVTSASSLRIEEDTKIRHQSTTAYEGHHGCLAKEKGKHNLILCHSPSIYTMSRVSTMVWFLGKREW